MSQRFTDVARPRPAAADLVEILGPACPDIEVRPGHSKARSSFHRNRAKDGPAGRLHGSEKVQVMGQTRIIDQAAVHAAAFAALDKGRALLRVYFHRRKVRAAATALAAALAESREVWSWPGDRLPVGDEMSQQVERLTRRLKLETEAHVRLEALFKSAGGGRSVLAL
jgi:hypothetical protein